MSFSAVGQVFDIQAFREHLAALPTLSWAKGVTVHHTAYPDLSMRPKGWTIQHMRNIADYYNRQKRWGAGPHLFTDEDQIFGMTPLTQRGVHAVAFNASGIGIEALGNYDKESPHDGRGALVWETTAQAVAAVLIKLGLPANESTITFHRDDPSTSKTCPGKLVSKTAFVARVSEILNPSIEESSDDDDDLDVANSNQARARELLKKALELLGS